MFGLDTELREPIQITNTPEEEDEPIWSKNSNQLIFLSGQAAKMTFGSLKEQTQKNTGGKINLKSKRLTNDASTEYGLSLSQMAARLLILRTVEISG